MKLKSNISSSFLFFVFKNRLVVISEGHPPNLLIDMNSVIRRIDLTCKLVAPVISGFIISFVSLKASALMLALLTTIFVWVEYWLFMSVYNGIPTLGINSSRRRISQVSPSNHVEDTISTSQERNSLVSNDGENSATADKSFSFKIIDWISKVPYIEAWKVYLQQDVVLPGIALALLFFTVLR